MRKLFLRKTAVTALSAVLATSMFPVNAFAETPSTTDDYVTKYQSEGYELKWNDEFDGTSLNTEDWNVETHEPGWVNAELQRYTSLDEGNIVVSDGNLKILPHVEIKGGSESGSLEEQNQGGESQGTENQGTENQGTEEQGTENQGSQEQENETPATTPDEGGEEQAAEPVVTEVTFDFTVSGDNHPDSDTMALQVNFGKVSDSEAGTAAATVSLYDISLTDDEGNEVLRDTTFQNGDWSFGTPDGGAGSVSYADGKAVVSIENSGSSNYCVQLQQTGLSIKNGKTYHFSMKATSDVDRQTQISVLDPENGWNWYGGTGDVPVTIAGTPAASQNTEETPSTNNEGETQGTEEQNQEGTTQEIQGNEENNTQAPAFVGNVSFDFTVNAESSTNLVQVNFGKIDSDEASATAAANVVISGISIRDEDGNELLNNTTFANGGEGWSCGITEPAQGSYSFADGKAYINIKNSGDQNWQIQLQQTGIHLVPGKKYTFAMNATSNVDRMAEISVMDHPDADTWNWFGGTKATIKGSAAPSGGDDTEGGYGEITSGRITTQNKHDFTYGRFEARAKVPTGKGYLPAFWLMATDEGNYGQWPKCGEMDIMEVMGQDTTTSYHTIHYGYDSGSGHKENQGTNVITENDYAADWHTFTLDWDPGVLTWYVDGEKVYTTSDWYTGTDDDNQLTYPAPFDQDFYVILNLAVGGSWVGYPTDDVYADMNNQAYEVDYVRVYQKSAEEYERLENEAKKPEKVISYREPDESGNYVINGDFQQDIAMDGSAEASKDNWVLHTESDTKASTYTISKDDKAITINPSAVGSVNYAVQLKQENVPMYKGWEYELSFDAYATEEREIIIDVEGPDRGWTRYFNDTTVKIGTQKQTYTYAFTMNDKNDPNGSLEFNLGNQGSTAAVTISNVRLVHKSGDEIAEDTSKVVRPDGNYIYNGGFDQGEKRLGYWEISDEDKASVSVTNKNGVRELKVVVAEGDAVTVRQSGLSPIGEGDYSFTFNARGDVADGFTVDVAGTEYTPELETTNKDFSKNLHFNDDNDREGSYVELTFNKAGTYYVDNLFLTEASLLRNGSFNAGIAGFTPYIDGAAKANYVIDNMNGNHNTFAITIEDTGANTANDWYVQLNQDNISLEQGKSYRLSFRAKSSIERLIKYSLGEFEGTWANYSGTTEPVTVNDQWKVYTAEFKMEHASDPKTRFNITFGSVGGNRIETKHDVYVDDITLIELDYDVTENKTSESSFVDGNTWGEIAEFTGDKAALKDAIIAKFGEEVPERTWYAFKNTEAYNIVTEAGAVTGIGAAYTGSAITFNEDVFVFNGNRLLIENRDYTLSYSNNTAAVSALSQKAPTVTVKGAGSFKFTSKFTFTINPDDINKADITSEKVVTVLAGNKTVLGSTKPVVTYNGKKLTLNKDYTLNYFEDNNGELGAPVANPAKQIISTADKAYRIQVVAKEGSNFFGTHETTVKVTPVDNKKNIVQINKVKATTAKGKALTFDWTGTAVDIEKMFKDGDAVVKNGSTVLTYEKDYTIRVVDDGKLADAGKHSFVVVGAGKEKLEDNEKLYVGERTFTYEVKGTALSSVKFAGLKTTVEYNGNNITVKDLFKGDKVADKYNWTEVTLYNGKTFEPLTKGDDYEVTAYTSGVVGKHTFVFTGTGKYTGSVKKVITVSKANVNTATVKVTDKNITYVKSGAKPAVKVVAGGKTLVNGIDYKVSYKNNVKVSDSTAKNAPQVIVTGIGNYSGTNKTAKFSIVKGKISQVNVVLKDVTYKKGKSGYYFSAPKLMDDGKALSVGKNKDVESYKQVYTYAEDTKLEDKDGTVRKAGETVDKKDLIPAGTIIKVTIPVNCSKKSPYVDDTTKHELVGTFKVAAPAPKSTK